MQITATHSTSLLPPLEISPDLSTKIQKIALPILLELTASLAIGAICSTFVATPAGATLLATGIVIQLIVNITLRFFIDDQDNWITPSVFALGTAFNAQTLIHEAGHALAIQSLLHNSKPTITLLPFQSGLTKFRVISPTDLGKQLGTHHIMPLVAAAGPALSLAVSSATLTAGLSLQEQAPELGRTLIVASLVDFLFHFVYALTALIAAPTDFAHDFITLSLAGIHPLASAITIAAIPAFIYLTHSFFSKSHV